MSNTIAVYNFKGGVGKTTTTSNLAFSWSRAFKVLVIDCDPQVNLTLALTNEGSHPSNLFSLSKKLLHNEQPEVNPVVISPYLHLIPGDYQMAELESNSQFIAFGHIIFYKLLSILRDSYDFILLDCPTHFGITVKSFLVNTNSILIPSIADSFSVAGFRKLLSYLGEVEKDHPLHILGIFFNQYKKNTLYHQKVAQRAEQELGGLILKQRIRESIRIGEAHEQNQSIYSIPVENAVAEDFLNLSEEVIEKFNTFELGEVLRELNIEEISN